MLLRQHPRYQRAFPSPCFALLPCWELAHSSTLPSKIPFRELPLKMQRMPPALLPRQRTGLARRSVCSNHSREGPGLQPTCYTSGSAVRVFAWVKEWVKKRKLQQKNGRVTIVLMWIFFLHPSHSLVVYFFPERFTSIIIQCQLFCFSLDGEMFYINSFSQKKEN